MVKLEKAFGVKLLYFGLISFMFMGCPHDVGDVQNIVVINNSKVNLVFCKEVNNQLDLDTTLNKEYPWNGEIPEFYIIQSKSSNEVREVKSNLQYILKNGWYKFYIFNHDSIKTIPWERIRDEYMVSKRVDFDTWEEMEECNFTIDYP